MSDSESFETAPPATVEPPANQAPPVGTTGARALAVREQPPLLLAKWEAATTQQKIQALIPKELSLDKFKRLVVSLIYRQPELSECDPVSFFSCISDCATMGMYPDSVTQKVFFIARRPKRQGDKKVCTIIVGFRGLRDLALQSPEILDVWPGIVREGDEFSIVRAPRQELVHKPDPRENGAILGFYSCAALRSGLTSYEWMPVSKVEEVRNKVLKGLEDWKVKQSPWTEYFEEMGKKTLIRRHFKSLPITETAREAMVAEEKTEERLIRNVTPGAETPLGDPQADPTGRPALPAPKRGGARAASEPPPAGATGSQQPPAGEQAKTPAAGQEPPKEAPPVSTPASGRRRGTAASSAAAATPLAAQTNGSSGSAAAKASPAPQNCPPIAPNVTLQGFHGKPWPQVITFEVVEIQPRLAGGTRPYLLLQIKAEGYEGEAVTFECAGVDQNKAAIVAKPNLMNIGAILEANFEAQAKAVKVDGKNVPDYSRPPALIAKNIGESKEPAFG